MKGIKRMDCPNALARLPRKAFERRWERLQQAMHGDQLDALVLTAPANLRYATGHAPLLSVAPTRPWYVIVPADGEAIGIVPEIGRVDAEKEGAFGDLRSWPSPRFDGAPEGVAEVAAALAALPSRFGRFGMELGRETRLGMSHSDVMVLMDATCPNQAVDASEILHGARAIKSHEEVARIKIAIGASQTGFDTVGKCLRADDCHSITERDLARTFAKAAISGGADAVPFLALCSGPGGYDSLTRAPGDRCLGPGDVVGLDAGCVFDGYWCDYNRNFALGDPGRAARTAHRTLMDATEAGIAALRPGTRASDVWRAIAARLPNASRTARYGHGVGLDLTEPPSIHMDDDTVLREGMVLTIEPSLMFERADGQVAIMAYEEICVLDGIGAHPITKGSATFGTN